METTTPSPVKPLLSIGGLLRQAREEKNISLKLIAHKTKINLSLLEFLEADDLRKLPNKAYVIGFIKSYAKILGIDEKKCLDYFYQTYNRVFPETLPAPKEGKSKIRKRMVIDSKKGPISFGDINLLWIGGSLGGLLVSLFLVILLTGTDEPETPVLAQEEVAQPTPPAPTVVKEEIKPQTLSASTPLETAKESPVKNMPDLQEKPAMAQAKDTGAIKEDSEFIEKLKSTVFRKIPDTPLYKVLHDDPNDDISEYLPDSVRESVISGQQNLYVTAVDGDSWLTYRKGKGRISQMHLKEGGSLIIQGNEIQLFMGNVNATKIFLNNLPLEIQSRTGVKSLIFPQNQKGKYHLPLFIYKKDGTVISSEMAIEKVKSITTESI